jgi:serine/threonine protein kinase/tetratricopeptide (TPR) repeat protein
MASETETAERTAASAMDDRLARAAQALAPADADLARARARGELFPEHRKTITLGRYVLLDRVGAGAMGVVYAAYDPELDRRVAVKVLHFADADDESQGQRRMLREARSLAKLSHPNVVTVHDVGRAELDGGAPESQRPVLASPTPAGSASPTPASQDATTSRRPVFIAMEFIDGPTLTRWLATARPWREVLAMFLQAGRGLAAAHAVGIVHRDFKPDNVLIGESAAGGEQESRARVTDFGLARALGGPPSGDDSADGRGSPVSPTPGSPISPAPGGSVVTAAGAVVGTPVYMAPEQHLGREVDARADQFAFCVALWEGLYRQRPFGSASLQSLMVAVVEGRLTPPPTDSDVPGWLRTVVARGLSREPEERWPTMQHLVDALSRDPGRRRRRIAAAVGAGVVAVLAVGTLEGTRRVRAASCARDSEAVAVHWNEEAKSALEAAFASTALPYATDAFTSSAARLDRYVADWSRARSDVCSGETSEDASAIATAKCLDDGARALAELVDQLSSPDRRAVALSVHSTARLRPPASCADPIRHRRFLVESDDPELGEQRADLRARLHQARTLNWLGHAEEAERVATTVRTEIEADPRLADMLAPALAEEGSAAEDAGHRDVAEQRFLAAFERAAADGDDEGMAHLASRLTGLVGDRLDRPAEGLVWARVGDALLARSGAMESDVELDLLGSHGAVLQRRGDFAEAVELHQRAAELVEARFGSQHPRLVGVLTNLGNSQDAAGDHRGAIDTHRRGVALAEALFGPWHPDVSRTLNNLGNAHDVLGEYDAALAVHQRALEIRTASLPPDHPSIASTLSNLGNVYRELGRYDESLTAHRRALDIRERTLGAGHLDVAMSHGNLGLTYEEMGVRWLALQHHLLAWNAFEAELGTKNPNVALAIANVGSVEALLGALDEGRAHLQRSLAMFEATVGPEHSSVVLPLKQLALVAVEKREWSEALRLSERALATCEATLGAEHPRIAGILLLRARALAGAGRRADAVATAERAVRVRERVDASAADLDEARAVLAEVSAR